MGSCKIPKPRDPSAAIRAEVVELLFAYVDRLRHHFESVAASHDLTPVQGKLILFLGEPEPMRHIADCLGCDPSNITGVVDRLEERELVARREDPTDRRVKILGLTAAGQKLRDALELNLFRNVPGMESLTRAQVADLRDALASLCRPAQDLREPAARLVVKR